VTARSVLDAAAASWTIGIRGRRLGGRGAGLLGRGGSPRRHPRDRRVGTEPDVVVGMSLSGLTTLRLTALAPELVPRAVIVDVTPSAQLRRQAMTRAERGTTALVQGPATPLTLVRGGAGPRTSSSTRSSG